MKYYSALIVLLFFLGMPAFAEDKSDVFSNPDLSTRESIIEKDLQAAADHMNAETKEMDQQKLQNFGEKLNEDLKEVHEEHKNIIGSFEFEDKDAQYNDPRERLKKIELALQVETLNYQASEYSPANYYAYVYTVGNDVEKNAKLYGFHGSYTFRRAYKCPVHNWNDLKAAEKAWSIMPSFVRLEGDVSFGKISYDSFVTGKKTGFDTWLGNFKLLGGYDFMSQDSTFVVTPYVGVGYRRLTDKTGAWVDFYVYNWAPFENIYNYFYMPVGIETTKILNEKWDLTFKLEGDLVLAGDVTLSYGDIPTIFPDHVYGTGKAVNIHLRDTESPLQGGLGFNTSFKGVRKFEKLNIFAEPFMEFWYIKKSRKEQAKLLGDDGLDYVTVYSSDGTPYKPAYEPKNYTLSFGMRLGVQF